MTTGGAGESSAGQPKLFIFPHAGGSAQYYVPFAKTFATDIKRVAVQYPGQRGKQDFASFTSLPALADEVCKMVSPDKEGGVHGPPIAFFGHSMGGLLAFEVARRFEEAGRPIAALFVSAVAAPGRVGYEDIPDDDEGLLAAVSSMTGANPEFMKNPEFAAAILPTLRGLKAIANYTCPPDVTLSCPIHAFYGDDDEIATADKVKPWAERTTADFTAREFSGHHFYLNDHLGELVSDLEQKLWSRLRE
ncbi:alpha/beta fold hydrolase [Mycolicibacterium austroafricanum]|uniref:Thioesterase TesA n=1 Tax=Mycolicibacterium austroafricanum TaxID=39687 RepID=A0ABT8HD84_MYCAO|nr:MULTISPECIES: alpha/beta fold hydrolase [Mycolicibacterium]MDN4518728.1 alpha/beta fold hydrolase [Mycolicibacterium austroafricanum]QRZ09673.1 thioesterase [Mycolicibacterium austroafricanum]QZT66086.1 alpha/beta fold hydrolase [Mycolicibacterium austroafricanum]UJL27603.1 thioesterase [Mycolicibacterium vanbaalenii]WND54284.1 alpha/beta fold hydrolase [Mycolicibacterium vanbaalenii]